MRFLDAESLDPLLIWTEILLTLIHLTLYRYSHQPTVCHSLQHSVSIFFGSGRLVTLVINFSVEEGPGSQCTLYTVHGAERRGGVWAQFRQNDAFFYALLTHFLPKTNVTFVYRTQKFLCSFWAKSALKEGKRKHHFV